jgi:hypothetical protein
MVAEFDMGLIDPYTDEGAVYCEVCGMLLFEIMLP